MIFSNLNYHKSNQSPQLLRKKKERETRPIIIMEGSRPPWQFLLTVLWTAVEMVENTPNGPLIGEDFPFSLAFVSPIAYWTSVEISLGLGIPREASAFSMTFEIPCPIWGWGEQGLAPAAPVAPSRLGYIFGNSLLACSLWCLNRENFCLKVTGTFGFWSFLSRSYRFWFTLTWH